MNLKAILPYKNIIAGLTIIIIFGVAIRNVFFHYSLQKEEIAVKRQKLKEKELTIKRWNKVKAAADNLDSVFLIEDTLSFKKFVEKKAKDSKINILSLRISNVKKDLYQETVMQLNIRCAYDDFIIFTKAIEEKSIVIEKTAISRDRRGENTMVELTLKGFILKK